MTTVALHHVIDGPAGAPPLLLGSSLGTDGRMWEPQVAGLREHVRAIRFDHRGHGRSPVPPGPYALDDLGRDVLALMDALGLARASYCGLSIGGLVGMWLAIRAPERIDRLVLVCTAAHFPPASGWHERAATVRAAGSVEPIADAVLARWVTPAFAAARPERLAALRALLTATPAEGYAGCCEALAAADLRARLGEIAAPTLVIAGDDDPATPPRDGAAIATAVPGARLEVLAPMAHLGNVEQPEAVTRLILDHLRTAEDA